MFKKLWLKMHWLLGITAGIVLAAMGVTGAALSFEHDLLKLMNPGVMSVAPQAGAALAPDELLAHLHAALPGRRITGLTLTSDPDDAVRVMLVPPGGGRAEPLYVDPYSGEVLGKAEQGEALLHWMEDVHRRLAYADAGKQVTGAATIGLLVLSLSGLYLRWPRRWKELRSWFKVDFSMKGRNFLRNLHSVAGTWVLLPYLLMALTGLFWSYDWYRSGLYALTGVTPPLRQGPSPGGGGPAEPMTIDAAWSTFQRIAGSYSQVTVNLPAQPGAAVQFSYLDVDPPHSRASNRLVIDPVSGDVREHQRYADKAAGAKLMGSIFSLHSGGFFGVAGQIAFMLASLLMPLFAITGWMLYLDRRRKRRAVRRRVSECDETAGCEIHTQAPRAAQGAVQGCAEQPQQSASS